MAVYTPVDETDLQRLLADFDLGPAVSCKGIAEGVENSNFLLDTAGGRFILTLYERRVREGDLPYFLGLMGWLAGRGFPCPTPRADRAGRVLKTVRGRPAALVSFLDGVSVQHPGPAHGREAGAALARLHRAGEGFSGRRENTLGQSAWASLFAGLEGAAEALKPGLAAEVAADLASLARLWPADLPGGAIHADFFPDNVFFAGGRFSAAIDLAIARVAGAWDGANGVSGPRARAMIEGYDAVRPFGAAERAALPVLAWGASMRFFLTRLADWGEARPGALVRPKDPMEYEARLRLFRTLQDPFAA